MRPFGGAFFGNFGDKYGRKNAMIITITGFSVVTFCTGLLPTWQTVGILAPILLIIIRFLQGFFAGGEWGSGAVISMESSPKPMRGLLSGSVQSGFTFGFLLASISFQLTQFVFPDDKFIEIGWRVLFFTGILPGLLALFVRLKMNESNVWIKKVKEKKIARIPLKNVLSNKENRKRFFLSFDSDDWPYVFLLYLYRFYAYFIRKVCKIRKTRSSNYHDCYYNIFFNGSFIYRFY